ncbi:MAG TPA: hypothetical protein VFU55_02875 [Terracidiphilus sp.]|nr:hypothetical protein [Terracidiphilus sp.]
MKFGVQVFLSCAMVASIALINPQPASASGAPTDTNSSLAQDEAMQMVPVEASLEQSLDTHKLKPGAQFEVKLQNAAHLKNGPELPKGTVLIGEVTTDHIKANGASRLVLRFSEARLKDGKMIPIQATIMNILRPESSFDTDARTQASDGWNGKTLLVNQTNALSGVDLHSRIGEKDSGVFVSRKDKIKLAAGTHLTLAIAATKAA